MTHLELPMKAEYFVFADLYVEKGGHSRIAFSLFALLKEEKDLGF